MKSKQLFAELPRRHYATVATAIAAADMFATKLTDQSDQSGRPILYTIGAGTDKAGNARFFPIFLPNSQQTFWAFTIANHGFPVARV